MSENDQRTIRWYIEKAKAVQELQSDRQLSLALGKNASVVHYWLSGKAFPSAEMMIRLAVLAEVPEEIALADLGYWTNFDNEAADAYAKLASMALKMSNYGKASMIGLAMVGSVGFSDFEPTAHAVSHNAQSINYARQAEYFG